MTLWIIAALAGAVLFAGLAFLASWRDGERPPEPRHPDPREGPSSPGAPRLPPAGVPMRPTLSEENATQSMESTELWIDDDEPSGPVPQILVHGAGRTDPGRRREHNEDALLVLPDHDVYAIADGMGGYAAGEVAAALAVDTIAERFESGEHGTLEEGLPRRGAELVAAIRAAHERIRTEALLDVDKSGMGTTVVAMRFSSGRGRAYIASVGDSRCYRVRDRSLKQLTVDHTLAALGIVGPTASKLSRALGVFEHVDVDLTVDEPRPGDVYLLCSDGLYKMLPEGLIRDGLEADQTPEQLAEALVAEANARGGRDNVSVLVVRVAGPDLPSS